MPYTLAMFLLWAVVFAVVGAIVGWLLRSLRGRAELARARSSSGDGHELERLRAQAAEYAEVVAERDRLRMEIADVRGRSAGTLGFASTVDPSTLEGTVDHPSGLATLVPAADGADADEAGDAKDDGEEEPPIETTDDDQGGGVDLDAAAAVLGRSVRLDDLTVIEGVGPKIAELCAAIGLDTWRSLADTDVTVLQSMLDDAGPRFKMHQPDSWPQQAALLAAGDWEAFRQLTDELSAGR